MVFRTGDKAAAAAKTREIFISGWSSVMKSRLMLTARMAGEIAVMTAEKLNG